MVGEHSHSQQEEKDTKNYVQDIMDLQDLGTSSVSDPMATRSPLYATFALVALFVALSFLNVSGSFSTTETYSVADEEEAIRFEIYAIAQNIDAYREEYGVLPEALELIGLAEEGIEYENLETSYILIGSTTGRIIRYTDGDDLAPYETAVDRLLMEDKS